MQTLSASDVQQVVQLLIIAGVTVIWYSGDLVPAIS